MADNVVTLTNPIELRGQCVVVVWDNPFKGTDGAVMSGVLSSGSGDLEGSLEKQGPGALYLTANNTYQGSTIVDGGTLYLTGDNAHTRGTILNGGTLVATKNSSLGPADSELTFNSGTLELPDSFGGASRAGSLAAGGGTIDTAAAVSFTLTRPRPASGGRRPYRERPRPIGFQ
jgi:fibronectin-binding autotransporter adhesin